MSVDLLSVLRACGGVAEVRDLARQGFSDKRVRAALAAGELVRVRRGCYALPGADPLRVAEKAWRAPATCITLARELGLPVLSDDERLHLLFHADRSVGGRNLSPPRDVLVHYSVVKGQSVRPTLAAVDSSARCLSREAQLVLVDAALNRGTLLVEDLALFRTTSVARSKWLARHCDPGAQSLLETLTRLALTRAGLAVRSQVQIDGVGRVDLLVEGTVIVELDGRETHALEEAFARDRARDRAAVVTGYRVLRYTYADVMGRMDMIVNEVRRALSH